MTTEQHKERIRELIQALVDEAHDVGQYVHSPNPTDRRERAYLAAEAAARAALDAALAPLFRDHAAWMTDSMLDMDTLLAGLPPRYLMVRLYPDDEPEWWAEITFHDDPKTRYEGRDPCPTLALAEACRKVPGWRDLSGLPDPTDAVLAAVEADRE